MQASAMQTGVMVVTRCMLGLIVYSGVGWCLRDCLTKSPVDTDVASLVGGVGMGCEEQRVVFSCLCPPLYRYLASCVSK